jgi:hypothetical protein
VGVVVFSLSLIAIRTHNGTRPMAEKNFLLVSLFLEEFSFFRMVSVPPALSHAELEPRFRHSIQKKQVSIK